MSVKSRCDEEENAFVEKACNWPKVDTNEEFAKVRGTTEMPIKVGVTVA